MSLFRMYSLWKYSRFSLSYIRNEYCDIYTKQMNAAESNLRLDSFFSWDAPTFNLASKWNYVAKIITENLLHKRALVSSFMVARETYPWLGRAYNSRFNYNVDLISHRCNALTCHCNFLTLAICLPKYDQTRSSCWKRSTGYAEDRLLLCRQHSESKATRPIQLGWVTSQLAGLDWLTLGLAWYVSAVQWRLSFARIPPQCIEMLSRTV